jgi:hypothetical protein
MFKYLLTVSLLLTAGTSAYMSVRGLTLVFTEYLIPIALMGTGMELGKILTIVYVHRNWKRLIKAHKVFYIFVVFLLVILTSGEIAGILSQGYAQNRQETSLISSRQGFLEQERNLILEELEVLEKTLSGLPKTYVTKRFQFREDNDYEGKRRRLLEINTEISEADADNVSARLSAGPIFAVGRLLDVPDARAIIFFILLLVGVVEPLSVGLTVAVSSQWAPQINLGHKMSPEHRERIKEEQKTKKRFRRGK